MPTAGLALCYCIRSPPHMVLCLVSPQTFSQNRVCPRDGVRIRECLTIPGRFISAPVLEYSDLLTLAKTSWQHFEAWIWGGCIGLKQIEGVKWAHRQLSFLEWISFFELQGGRALKQTATGNSSYLERRIFCSSRGEKWR